MYQYRVSEASHAAASSERLHFAVFRSLRSFHVTCVTPSICIRPRIDASTFLDCGTADAASQKRMHDLLLKRSGQMCGS